MKKRKVRLVRETAKADGWSQRQDEFKTMSFEQFKQKIPPQMRWMVDCDYFDKLGPEERRWLLTYLDEEYRASFPRGEKHILQGAAKKQAQNYVRSQGADRRPDLMNFNDGYVARRVSLDDVSESELQRALDKDPSSE